jgi:hypothetical protein
MMHLGPILNESPDSGTDRPVIVYSLSYSIGLDLALAVAAAFVGVYYMIASAALTGAFVLCGLFFLDCYFRLWRRRVRTAEFYEGQVRIVGWRTKVVANYHVLGGLSRTRSLIGDFRTGSTVSFTLGDRPEVFVIPNRKIRALKTDLYSWLVARTQQAINRDASHV